MNNGGGNDGLNLHKLFGYFDHPASSPSKKARLLSFHISGCRVTGDDEQAV